MVRAVPHIIVAPGQAVRISRDTILVCLVFRTGEVFKGGEERCVCTCRECFLISSDRQYEYEEEFGLELYEDGRQPSSPSFRYPLIARKSSARHRTMMALPGPFLLRQCHLRLRRFPRPGRVGQTSRYHWTGQCAGRTGRVGWTGRIRRAG